MTIFVGTQSNGQGHETVYAQFLADQTGVPANRIGVVQGDSDLIAKGGGTGGSRSVTVQNNALRAIPHDRRVVVCSLVACKKLLELGIENLVGRSKWSQVIS